jgi:hypothetical protein
MCIAWGKSPPSRMDGLINIPDSSFFITNQKYNIKTEEGLTSRSLWCNGVTLFYTRGLGIVVSCVMAPQSCGLGQKKNTKRKERQVDVLPVSMDREAVSLPLQQFRGKAGWGTAVAAIRNLPSSNEYQVQLLSYFVLAILLCCMIVSIGSMKASATVFLMPCLQQTRYSM